MNYYIKSFNFLSEESLALRMKVFVEEQGFYDEVDNIDKIATHIVLFDNNHKGIATCRIFEGEDKNSYILGRLCVLKEYRGKGIGKSLLAEAEKIVVSLGGNCIKLHSQYKARDFYKKSGYTEYGEIEYEQDCPHIWLEKHL